MTIMQIIEAVRCNKPVPEKELRRTVVAFDVFAAWSELSNYADVWNEFDSMMHCRPADYIGPNNDPQSPSQIKWFECFMDTF